MRRVAPVMPIGETGIIGLETGHDPKDAAAPQEASEPVELCRGLMKMLGDLRTDDEIVGALERRFVGLEKGIEEFDRHPALLQHCCCHRTGAAAVVQSDSTLVKTVGKRFDELGREPTVARILNIILVLKVMLPLRFAV